MMLWKADLTFLIGETILFVSFRGNIDSFFVSNLHLETVW